MELDTIKKFGFQISAGKTIFNQDDKAENLFFILSGDVDIYIRVRNSQKKVATLNQGDIFGEMAVVDAKPRSATAIAKTNVKALAINIEQLNVIIKTNPSFAIKMIRILSNKLREANDQITELLIKDKRKIVASALVDFSINNGLKTFKGYKLIIQEFLNSAVTHLGMEKENIRQTINSLLKDGYLIHSAKSTNEVILTERLQSLAKQV
jgi:CRP-like cAMP-binding protein